MLKLYFIALCFLLTIPYPSYAPPFRSLKPLPDHSVPSICANFMGVNYACLCVHVFVVSESAAATANYVARKTIVIAATIYYATTTTRATRIIVVLFWNKNERLKVGYAFDYNALLAMLSSAAYGISRCKQL